MNLFWALICAVGIVALQGWLFGRVTSNRLTCRREFSRRSAFCGETVEMTEVLRNTGLTPAPWVCVESRISTDLAFLNADAQRIVRDQYHRSYFYMPPRVQITRRHTIHCLSRGYYNLSSVTMSSGDLFGVSQNARTLDMRLHLSVYPRLLTPDELPAEALRWQGEMITRRYVDPDPFYYRGVRAYRPGDPPKDIHWRAAARTGSLMTRQYEYTSSPRAMLLLNIQPSANLWGEIGADDLPDIEHALSMCLTLALYALKQGAEAGIACNGRLPDDEDALVPPAGGESQRARLLDYSARVMLGRALNFHTFLLSVLPRLYGQDLLVISAYRDELMDEALDKLRLQRNRVSFLSLRKRGVSYEAV